MSSCQVCKNEKGERYTSTEGADGCDVCIEGYYMDADGACRNCLSVVVGADKTFPGVMCPAPSSHGGGSTLSQLLLQPGYYRFEPSSQTGCV